MDPARRRVRRTVISPIRWHRAVSNAGVGQRDDPCGIDPSARTPGLSLRGHAGWWSHTNLAVADEPAKGDTLWAPVKMSEAQLVRCDRDCHTRHGDARGASVGARGRRDERGASIVCCVVHTPPVLGLTRGAEPTAPGSSRDLGCGFAIAWHRRSAARHRRWSG